MTARFRSWLRSKPRLHSWVLRNSKPIMGVLIVVELVLIILMIKTLYTPDWTGFSAYTIITTSKTSSGVASPTITTTTVHQPEKTLWDWLQLLIIPAVLAVGGFVINLTISRGEQEATKQRTKTEHEIAADIQRETALQVYLDKMSELLLHENLRESDPEKEVRKIARVRTLTVLGRLDSQRKRSVIQFLYESGLIDKDKRIVNLKGIDLEETNLMFADLHGADLRGVSLYRANLGFTDLSEADLGEVSLSEADLRGANLSGADLSNAHLTRACLVEANLGNADLHGAYLHRAALTRAYLGGADLSGANLHGATMYETKLIGANLSGADLSIAKVTIEQLDKAKSLKGATMPDGSIHP